QDLDDLGNRRVVQISHPRSVAEEQVVDVLVRISLAEGRAATALELHRILARHDDPAAGDDRDVEHVAHQPSPETNAMNSLYAACEPAQVILSSPPSPSAKRRMVLAARGPFQPQSQ